MSSPFATWPFGRVRVLPGDDLLHLRHGDAVAVQLVRIHFDAYRGKRSADGVYLAHSADLRDPLFDHRGSGVVNGWDVVDVGLDAEHHDGRIGRIDLAVRGICRQVRWKVRARCVDAGLNVACGSVDVTAKIELQGDAGGAKRAGRSHLRDAGDVPELALERA